MQASGAGSATQQQVLQKSGREPSCHCGLKVWGLWGYWLDVFVKYYKHIWFDSSSALQPEQIVDLTLQQCLSYQSSASCHPSALKLNTDVLQAFTVLLCARDSDPTHCELSALNSAES